MQRDLAREHVGREQPLEEVVVATVALASREAEHAGDGGRLEHGADGVRRHAEPVGRRPLRTLEVGRRQRPLGADALEHLSATSGFSASRRVAWRLDVPRNHGYSLVGTNESLVLRLEDLAPLVELLAPGGSYSATRACRTRSCVRPATASGSNWIEPSRWKTSSTASGPPSSERAGASTCRATRKTTCGLGTDPHRVDAIACCAGRPSRRAPALRR